MGWGTLHCCYCCYRSFFFFLSENSKKTNKILKHIFPQIVIMGNVLRLASLLKIFRYFGTCQKVFYCFGKYNTNWKIKRISPTSPYSSHTSTLIPEYHKQFNGHNDRNLVRLVTRVYINHYDESKNNKLFIHHTGFSTVHHPALQTWALSFENQEVALQRLFRAWTDEGRIVLLCSQKSKGQIPNTRSNTHNIHLKKIK